MNAPNARFGAFEVLKRLAVGGMGEIFLARQTAIKGFERLAIIKTLLPDVQEDEERVEMFLAEARIAALLNHPNIVQVFDVGEQDGTYYIAMEYVEGDTLGAIIRAALKAQRHSPWPFVPIMAQAARALHYAHHQVGPTGQPLHLVHRDISPQNIMVRRDGVTKVVDFGIAKVATDGVRTKTGIIKGKLAYMSPEQLRADLLDGRADLYALGVVAWEMFTGRRMFHNVPDVDIFKTILDGAITPPSQMVPGFPPALEAVVMKSMALAPDDRYQDGNAFADALEGALKQAGDVMPMTVAQYVDGLVGESVRARSSTGIATVARQAPTPARGTRPDIPAQHQVLVSAEPSGSIPVSESDISALKTQHTAAVVPDAAPPTQVAKPRSMSNSAQPVRQDPPSQPSMPAMTQMGQAPQQQGRPAWVFAVGGALGALVLVGGAMVGLRGGTPAAPATPPTVPPPVAQNPAPPSTPDPAPARNPDPAPPVAAPDPVPPVARVDDPDPQPTRRPDRKSPDRSPPRKTDPAPAKPPPAPAPVAAPTPAPAPAPAAAETGLLSLASEPWASVTLDGKPLGTTPLFKIAVAPGTHEVVLTNEAEGLTKKITVTVQPGEKVVRKVNLK